MLFKTPPVAGDRLPTLTTLEFEPPPVFTVVGLLVACTFTVSAPVPLLRNVVAPTAVLLIKNVLPPEPRLIFNFDSPLYVIPLGPMLRPVSVVAVRVPA